LKITFITIAMLLMSLAGLAAEGELSESYQQDLVDRINHLRGRGPAPESLSGLEHRICGTPTAMEAFINRDRLDAVYKASAAFERRTDLPYSYVSPAEHFRVHYNTTGTDAIYQPTLDTLDGGDGIPDYINKIAEIADSVWIFEVDHLGFPEPARDDSYPEGLDSLYDIYVAELGGAYYGATWAEAILDDQTISSYLELDNDYNFYPYNEYSGDPRDFDRRLDAARVTMAHEFFHAIHFTMDWTEWEGASASEARMYWWEMSAVWMEEMMYDEVDDYLGYLSAFYDYPWKGLRFWTTSYPLSLRPYGACVFPMYLTERFDTSIVRTIWENCRDLGVGPQWPAATDAAIQEYSGGSMNLKDAIREFSVWNMFTGDRRSQAPPGIGFSEGAAFSEIPDSVMFRHDEYPIIYSNDSVVYYYGGGMAGSTSRLPEIMGANYIDIYNLSLISDTLPFYFTVDRIAGWNLWNLSLVGFPLDGISQATVEMFDVPERSYFYQTDDHTDFYNMVAIITPVTTTITEANYLARYDYGFFISDSLNSPADTTYKMLPPYPNPVFMSSADEYITFLLEKPVIGPSGDELGRLEVTIFNIAGEKIRELTFNEAGVYLSARWDMKNKSGKKVAAGAYLAYCNMIFSNGTPAMIGKYKVAVLP